MMKAPATNVDERGASQPSACELFGSERRNEYAVFVCGDRTRHGVAKAYVPDLTFRHSCPCYTDTSTEAVTTFARIRRARRSLAAVLVVPLHVSKNTTRANLPPPLLLLQNPFHHNALTSCTIMETTATAPVEDNFEALDMEMLIIDVPHPPNPMPRFYVSGVSATRKPAVLVTLQLTHLVSIGAEPGKILASQFQPGRTSLSFPKILDIEEQDLLSSLLPTLLPFLAATTPEDTILVHCQAGQSRSVAAVLMYLIICQGLTLVDAHAQVARSRPGVCVNPGFLRQLLFLEDFPGLRRSPFTGTKCGANEFISASFTDTESKATALIQSSRRRSAMRGSWAAEHRLYLLNNLFRVTCRLSSLEPVQVWETIDNEHRKLVKLLIRYGHACRKGPPVEEEGGGEEEEEEVLGEEEEARGKGWVARCRHCHQLLCTEEDVVRHAGEEIDILKKRTRVRARGIGRAAPAAESVWGYGREFERQPVLHLLPLSHACVKTRKAEEEKRKKEGKRRNIENGEDEGKGEGGRHGKSRTTCRHRYVFPPPWVMPSLLTSERGGDGISITATDAKEGTMNVRGGIGRGGGKEGGMVDLRCPGRHCGAVVGSMQARPEEGRREKGGCECLEPLPVVVVRFWEEALMNECAREERGREGWKEREDHGGLCVK